MTDSTKGSGGSALMRVPGNWVVTYQTAAGQQSDFTLSEAKMLDGSPVRVGRNSKTNDIVLSDFSIAQDHCFFTTDGHGVLFVTDVGSSSGTRIDRTRIPANEATRVVDGGDVEIGNLILSISYEAGSGVAQAVEGKPEPAPVMAAPIVSASEPAKPSGPVRGTKANRPTGSTTIINWVFGIIAAIGVGLLIFGEGNVASSMAYQLVGAGILAAVLLQVAIMLWSSMHRSAAEARFYEESLEMLRTNVKTSSAHMLAERERATQTWNGLRKFRIEKKNPEGGGICSFYLKPHDNKPIPPFEPGQYLTFQLRVPGKDKPIIRCYSLSDSPLMRDYYRVSIKAVPAPRDKPELPPGLSSNFFHDQLNEGDILDCKAPGGKFFMDQTKHTPVVLIGGGIGLTPVLSMLNSIVLSGSKRETHFFYGVRNSKEHVMRDHLMQIDRDHENVHMHICYSNPEEGEELGRDYQHAERVSVELFKKVLPSNNYDFYICGPPPMMESLVKDLDEWGVPEPNVHFEAFGPASVKKAKPKPAEAAGEEAPKFEITFAKSGKTVAWDGSFDSILEFAEANEIAMDSGCRAGNCGTCITALKSGSVKYVEEPGAQPEDGSCLTCVSVPKSNLTLEV